MNKRHHIFLGLLFISLHQSQALMAQHKPINPDQILDRLEAHEIIHDSLSVPYQFFKPKELNKGTKLPLILFLHGAGERGNDNKKQLSWGVEQFISKEVQSQQPMYVIAPQCPDGRRWVEVDWSKPNHTMPEEPSLVLSMVWDEVDRLKSDLPIDTDRIYVIGLSMGGFGTWDLLQRYPNKIAAAIPICGGGDINLANRLVDIPIWVFHSEDDTVVQVTRSRSMFEAIVQKGSSKIRYTEFSDEGHNSWSVPFQSKALYRWLVSQQP